MNVVGALVLVVVVVGLVALAMFSGLLIERRRTNLFRRLYRDQSGELDAVREQLRLARVELGLPAPFGRTKDTYFDGQQLRERPQPHRTFGRRKP